VAELCGVLELVGEGEVLFDAPTMLIVCGGANVVTGAVVTNDDVVALRDSIVVVGKALEVVMVDGLDMVWTELVVDDDVIDNVLVLRRGC
jgi:hypothetical protein